MDRPVPAELDFIESLLVEMPWGRYDIPTGVYFLIDCGRIVYVGQTTVGARRVMSHLGEKRFDRALYLPVPLDEIDSVASLTEIEYGFIYRLQPELNSGIQILNRKPKPYHLDIQAWYGGQRDQERRRLEVVLEKMEQDRKFRRRSIYAQWSSQFMAEQMAKNKPMNEARMIDED